MGQYPLWREMPLVISDGNVEAAAYRNILEFHLLPYARRVYGHNFRLQDDNARPHRALQ